MAERFVSPFARFFTNDLKTLPGAKLYFYENGTTTPKAIYQDPFKTNQHTNPVIAGTLGAAADSFPPIFLDGTYTVELQSSAGVVQDGWPVDNVGGEQVQGQFDDYSAITSYSISQIVTGSDGNRYESTDDDNLNNDPTIPANRTTYWKQIFIIGDYVSTEAYGVGDYVTYGNGLFKCLQTATGQDPFTQPNYWQRIHNTPVWGSTASYRQYDRAVGSDGDIYISQQTPNLNHEPVGDSGAWWRPFWHSDKSNNALTLSGGGNLTAYRVNILTDSSTYTFPAANSVPSGALLIVIKPDQYRTAQPTMQRAGSDLIRNVSGTDTSYKLDYGYYTVRVFKSNGSNEWSY